MTKISKRKMFRIVWFSFGVTFLVWQWISYQSRGYSDELLESNIEIEVLDSNEKISFINKDHSQLELIFFPGGLVDPLAYVPLARSIAEKGYNIHIIKMPWRMSTKGYNGIKEIFDLKDKETKFVLGGHSQGAKMAAQFVYENPGVISGLYLLGTSHPRDIDMSAFTLPTIKIYAQNDGLASIAEVKENETKLPDQTELVEIKGGNHSQFAYTGKLLLDDDADITREDQHEQVVNHLSLFFEGI